MVVGSLGVLCFLAVQVMAAQFRNAFCVVRPPGHHAGPSGSTRAEAADGKRGELVGQGFCLINHVAVGARYALQSHSVRRVAIIDWDLHHGNGTEVRQMPPIWPRVDRIFCHSPRTALGVMCSR